MLRLTQISAVYWVCKLRSAAEAKSPVLLTNTGPTGHHTMVVVWLCQISLDIVLFTKKWLDVQFLNFNGWLVWYYIASYIDHKEDKTHHPHHHRVTGQCSLQEMSKSHHLGSAHHQTSTNNPCLPFANICAMITFWHSMEDFSRFAETMNFPFSNRVKTIVENSRSRLLGFPVV